MEDGESRMPSPRAGGGGGSNGQEATGMDNGAPVLSRLICQETFGSLTVRVLMFFGGCLRTLKNAFRHMRPRNPLIAGDVRFVLTCKTAVKADF